MATSEMRDVGAAPPEADEETYEGVQMTLVEHLDELRRRLFVCIGAIAVGSIVGFILWERVLGLLLLPMPRVPGSLTNGKLLLTDPGEGFMLALKLAIAVGLVLALPVVLYETWAFIAPALTRREKRYALPFTLLGVVLFATGVALGFVVLRWPLDFLMTFGGSNFDYAIKADSYFTFVAYFLLAFGIVFELPLVLTFMSLVGIVNSRLLRQKRMYILFGLWFLSCFITPGADPYSPVIIGAAFTVLFELTIILMRAIGK